MYYVCVNINGWYNSVYLICLNYSLTWKLFVMWLSAIRFSPTWGFGEVSFSNGVFIVKNIQRNSILSQFCTFRKLIKLKNVFSESLQDLKISFKRNSPQKISLNHSNRSFLSTLRLISLCSNWLQLIPLNSSFYWEFSLSFIEIISQSNET